MSARHERTGLNATIGVVRQRTLRGRDSDSFIVKGGWLARLFPIGTTAFSGDYTRNDNIVVTADRSWSVGAFAVQTWSSYGVSFYAGVRRYDIDRSDVRTEPITVFPIGGVLAF